MPIRPAPTCQAAIVPPPPYPHAGLGRPLREQKHVCGASGEARLSPNGPAVMEVAVRTPGDYLMDLLGLTYGVDWFELVVRAALGWELPQPPPGPVRYAASYLPVAPAGTVVAVEGLVDVPAHPCVVDASVGVSPGDHLPPARSSRHRVGQVVLAAGDREELDAALEAVRRTLVVVTRPGGPNATA